MKMINQSKFHSLFGLLQMNIYFRIVTVFFVLPRVSIKKACFWVSDGCYKKERVLVERLPTLTLRFT
jgi:hypothetical protein